MKKYFTRIFILCQMVWAVTSTTTALGKDKQEPLFASGQIMVKYKSSVQLKNQVYSTGVTGSSSVDQLNRQHQVKKMRRLFNSSQAKNSLIQSQKTLNPSAREVDLSQWYALEVAPTADILALCREFKKNSQVEAAEPNYILHAVVTPNDPSYSLQYAPGRISAPQAWDLTQGSTNVVVAIVDTGVDFNHPDLKDNIWTNTAEIAGNGIDDDLNGFVDDIRGWNFIANSNNVMDDNHHGTHCAGIAAGIGNNGVGIAGLNWKSRIMVVKGLDATAHGFTDQLYGAIKYAVDNGANVISNSWGGSPFSQIDQDVIDYAYSKRSIVVAAAGNDSTDRFFYPAHYNHVIAVASTDNNDLKSGFSTYGSWITVSAPGSNIYSTFPNNTYGYLSGTSMACPLVAGVAGLLQDRFPTYSYDQIVDLIKFKADNIDAQNPIFAGKLGTGRVNAYQSVLGFTESNAPVVSINPITPQPLSGTAFKISGQATDDTGVSRVEYRFDNQPFTVLRGTSNWSMDLDTFFLTNGVHTIFVRAIDKNGNISDPLNSQATFSVFNAGLATYSTDYKAPSCLSKGSSCDSGAGLTARGFILDGVELNQPNTVRNSCYDGNAGVYHIDPSIERVSIKSVNGQNFKQGKDVEVRIKDWNVNTSKINLYYTMDATSLNPVWVHISSIPSPGLGERIQTVRFTLQGGLNAREVQAVRAQSTISDLIAACESATSFGSGYVDHDDLVFAVETATAAAPQVTITSPLPNAVLSSTAVFAGTAAGDGGIRQVLISVDGNGVFTLAQGTTAWTFTLNTAFYPNGTHTLNAYAYDFLGNVSAATNLTFKIDNAVQLPTDRALYSSFFKAPACEISGNLCESGDLLVGRGTIFNGIEKNYPNTINNSCPDGLLGSFHNDESIDKLKVVSVDGGPFREGNKVRVEAELWAFNSSVDRMEFYYASDPNTLNWIPVGFPVLTNNGLNTVSSTFTLSAGNLQAIRGKLVYGASLSTSCVLGAYNDTDDLIFSVQASTLTIDVVSPTVQIVAPEKNSKVFGTVTISGLASDNVGISKVEVKVGAGAYVLALGTTSWSAKFDITPLPIGNYDISAKATDLSGNVTIATSSFVLLDNAAPSVFIQSPVNGSTLVNLSTISVVALDDDSIVKVQFWIDGVLRSTDTTAPYEFVNPGLTNGVHIIQARAFDNGGRISLANITVNKVSAATTPRVEILSPMQGSLTGSGVLIEGVADDVFGIKNYVLYLDGVATPVFFPSYSWALLNDGPHTIQLKATSHANVTGESPIVTVTKVTDTTPPTISIISPVQGDLLTPTVDIVVNAVDDVKMVGGSLMFDNQYVTSIASFPFVYSYTLPSVGGQHRFHVEGNDSAGNSAKASVEINQVTDAFPPTLGILYPTANANVAGTIPVFIVGDDANGILKFELYVNEVLKQTSSGPSTLSASLNVDSYPAGPLTLKAKVYDKSGYMTTESVIVQKVSDNQIPVVDLISPVENAKGTGSMTLLATATDEVGIAKVEFLLNGALYYTDTNYPYTVQANNIVAGVPTTITVVATDYSGKKSNPVSRVINSDSPIVTDLPPTVKIMNLSNYVQVSGSVPVEVFAADAGGISKVRLYVDGVLISTDVTSPYSFNWDSTAYTIGVHTIQVEATDKSGFVSTDKLFANKVIDSIGPKVTILTPANKKSFLSSFAVYPKISNSAGTARMEFYVDGVLRGNNSVYPYSWNYDPKLLSTGAHTLMVKAIGFTTSHSSDTVTFFKIADVENPTVLLTAPSNNYFYDRNLVLSALAYDNFGIAKVEFYLDNNLLFNDWTAPFGGPVVTASIEPLTPRQVKAIAYDLAGNVKVSNSVTIIRRLDTTPPVVSILSPADKSIPMEDVLPIVAIASDNGGLGINKVDFSIDGIYRYTDTEYPYTYNWETYDVVRSTKPHSIRVIAYDKNGLNASTTTTVTLLNPDTVVPSIIIVNPVNSSQVNGVVHVAALVSSKISNPIVNFFIDGRYMPASSNSPLELNWDTTSIADGLHEILADVSDNAGSSGSNKVFVLVKNVTAGTSEVFGGNSLNQLLPPAFSFDVETHPSTFTPPSGHIGDSDNRTDSSGLELYAFPNPIQPGKNPTFHAEGIGLSEVHLKLFDASGELAYESEMKEISQGADGRVVYEDRWNVANISSGFYTAVVTAKSADKTVQAKTRVALIR